jgi:GH25 family lysozyme M1 (1,4-beta-N-acetylmuramidase)
MPDITIADISEYQTTINADAYLAGGHEILICRTYNGYRPDYTMPGRREYLRSRPFAGVGWYAYLARNVDPAGQARGFIQTIGSLRANEWPILDLEEGTGDQTSRAQAWFDIVDPWAGFPSMLYSGAYFLQDQLSGAGHWHGRPLWIASYGAREPAAPHILWQYTDAHSFPGIPGQTDASVHHGTASELMQAVRGGQPPVPQPPPTEEEIVAIFAIQNPDGRLEVFVEKQDESIWHAYQSSPGGGWAGSEPGKPVGWFAMGTPGK